MKDDFKMPDDSTELFLRVLKADLPALKALQQSTPNQQSMPRAYASVILGCLPIRAKIPATQKEVEALLDSTITGCCKILLALQRDNGFFKYPDLRDKNLRFTPMIQAIVDKDVNAVQDGWVTLPDPAGETLCDVGECGIALLQAGTYYKNDPWKQAGLKAADWAVKQPCCAMFHDNAYVVSLLCEAYRVTNDVKYREAAWKKYRLGVAVGQIESGRWLDPVNARTASHFVILRALHDVQTILPVGADRDAVRGAASKAVTALVAEMDKLHASVTSHTLQELVRHAALYPERAKELEPYIQQTRAMLVTRTLRGSRVFAVVPLPELAALAAK